MNCDPVTTELSSVDISCFKICSQTSPDDKIALELIRHFCAEQVPGYNYLELGSYLGGSLLPHLISPSCSKILSVDRRVSSQPDERRASGYSYLGITTKDLINTLSQHTSDSTCLKKLSTHDGVVQDLDPPSINQIYPGGFQLSFIDAEHTNEAVFSDFIHVQRLASPHSIIMLHDSWMLGSGIQNIVSYLQFSKIPFLFRVIKDSVTAFFFGRLADEMEARAELNQETPNFEDYMTRINAMLWNDRKSEILNNLTDEEISRLLQHSSMESMIKHIGNRIKTKIRI